MPSGLRIVLASASPRRSELLRAAGVEFEVAPVDVDESLSPFADPLDAALVLAERKATASAAARSRHDEVVLGADTIVAVPRGDGSFELLGKPVDAADAERMLGRLSGSRHVVATAVCALRTADGARFQAVERTWVTMRPIEPRERADYVATGEWEGKAGAYAIQESADRFVTALEEGGFDNVVGLPVALALRLLREAGAGV